MLEPYAKAVGFKRADCMGGMLEYINCLPVLA